MLGEMICKFKECLTDNDGNIIVSFVVNSNERLNAVNILKAVKTSILGGKELLTVGVDVYRKKRTLNANAYFHLLVGKIAKSQYIGADECKKMMVIEYGSVARDGEGEMVGVKLPTTVNVGEYYPYARWFDKRTENGKEFNCYIFYKQTHILDKTEMARLIDGVVSEAKQLGIQTVTPDEIAKMVSLWEVK